MKMYKKVLSIVALLAMGSMEARVASAPAGAAKIVKKQRPKTGPKLRMEDYAQNKVLALQKNIVDDIFPKKATIERIVNEFKAEYPGPNKSGDTIILYNAIINDLEIKKLLTLENAVHIYRFITETISNAWDKQEELIWSY